MNNESRLLKKSYGGFIFYIMEKNKMKLRNDHSNLCVCVR